MEFLNGPELAKMGLLRITGRGRELQGLAGLDHLQKAEPDDTRISKAIDCGLLLASGPMIEKLHQSSDLSKYPWTKEHYSKG